MTGAARVEAFRLDADPGWRFALFRRARGAPRGAFVYAHPFGEEMNKSRRMAALQAQAFAEAGYAVLQVDLCGCGDSDGDLADARWDIWKRDLALASAWLDARGIGPIHLFGLRLGATLALAHWRDAPSRYGSALLWQPVVDGRAFVTQFLRVAVARHAIRGSGARATTQDLRGALSRGEPVEVAGYTLGSALASALDEQDLGAWAIPGAHVHWLEMRSAGTDTPPATASTLASWRHAGVNVDYRTVAAENFWTSIEVLELPQVVAATTALYAVGASAPAGGDASARP